MANRINFIQLSGLPWLKNKLEIYLFIQGMAQQIGNIWFKQRKLTIRTISMREKLLN
jgi:hypothetical protein